MDQPGRLLCYSIKVKRGKNVDAEPLYCFDYAAATVMFEKFCAEYKEMDFEPAEVLLVREEVVAMRRPRNKRST